MGLTDALKALFQPAQSYGGAGYTLISPDDTAASVKSLTSMIHARTWSGWFDQTGNYLSSWNYANTKIDYSAAVGDLRTNTLVMAAVRWAAKNLYDARLKVVTLDDDNKEAEIKNHELTQLFKRPNDYYSGATLFRGAALSWIIATEFYFIKVRSRASRVVELWYEPHWTIRPRWPEDGSEFISYYEIYRNGQWKRIEREDVFVVCDGFDPETRRGLINPASAMLREYYTDQQAAMFMAQLLKHGLVPPIAFSVGDKERPFNGDIESVKAMIMRKMSGDLAGEPIVTSDNITPHKLGYDYSSVGMKEVRQIPEERFCATIGISPVSLYLGTGLKEATYQNVKQFQENDYRSFIMPLHTLIAEQASATLLPDFGETENKEVAWDYAKTSILQPDKAKEWERVGKAYRDSEVITLNEAREEMGYKKDPTGDVYYSERNKALGDSLLDAFEQGGEVDEVVKPNGKAN